jgi:hypothetical protein
MKVTRQHQLATWDKPVKLVNPASQVGGVSAEPCRSDAIRQAMLSRAMFRAWRACGDAYRCRKSGALGTSKMAVRVNFVANDPFVLGRPQFPDVSYLPHPRHIS